jgi:hypothetical protein
MEKQQDMDDGYFLRWLRSKGGRFDEAADVRGGERGNGIKSCFTIHIYRASKRIWYSGKPGDWTKLAIGQHQR